MSSWGDCRQKNEGSVNFDTTVICLLLVKDGERSTEGSKFLSTLLGQKVHVFLAGLGFSPVLEQIKLSKHLVRGRARHHWARCPMAQPKARSTTQGVVALSIGEAGASENRLGEGWTSGGCLLVAPGLGPERSHHCVKGLWWAQCCGLDDPNTFAAEEGRTNIVDGLWLWRLCAPSAWGVWAVETLLQSTLHVELEGTRPNPPPPLSLPPSPPPLPPPWCQLQWVPGEPGQPTEDAGESTVGPLPLSGVQTLLFSGRVAI